MKSERGQTMVEFALVVLLLFLVVFGLIEFSRLFFAYATMSHGVREGARFGIVHPGETEAIESLTESSIILVGGTATAAVGYPDKDEDDYQYCQHDCRIVVTATATYDAWTPLVPDFVIVAQSTMHFE
jgi:hypothetical protein